MTDARAERRRMERDEARIAAVARNLRHTAFRFPWDGRLAISPRHRWVGPGITEPRTTSITVTFDFGYAGSGWWKNAEYDRCLHLSITHPTNRVVSRVDPRTKMPFNVFDCETPTDAEVWAWAVALFGTDAAKAWVEPAASTLDPYRLPNVVHARVFCDDHGPIIPTGEVYNLVPIVGITPDKVTHG